MTQKKKYKVSITSAAVLSILCICGVVVLLVEDKVATVSRRGLVKLLTMQNATNTVRQLKRKMITNNKANGVYVFNNVCLEPLVVAKEIKFRFEQFKTTHEIVIYDLSSQPGRKRLNVAGSRNMAGSNYWDVYFKNATMPREGATNIIESMAVFVVPAMLPNLHHFWQDTYIGLFEAMSTRQLLLPNSNNYILFIPPQIAQGNRLTSPPLYRYNCEDLPFCALWRTLRVGNYGDGFAVSPRNSRLCFHSALFGQKPHEAISKEIHRDAIRYVISDLNLTSVNENSKHSEGDLYVTIIQRKYRRIINTDELVDAAHKESFANVRVIDLERLTVREQIKIAITSRVLVGIQGAGLQWAIFMPANSTLIEIAWPFKSWSFEFKRYLQKYPLRFGQVLATDVQVNWDSYEKIQNDGLKVNREQQLKLLSSKRTGQHDKTNIYKYADIVANVDTLRQQLRLCH